MKINGINKLVNDWIKLQTYAQNNKLLQNKTCIQY